MKKLLLTMLLAGTLGTWSNPTPADAAVIECLDESIESCNGDFGTSSEKVTAIRGWCYMIRWAMCSWFD